MNKKKTENLKKFLKLSVIAICVGGFLFQALEFLNLYWTYPTVVDIQVSVPSEIDMPGITFCNENGIKPDIGCVIGRHCTSPSLLKFLDLCSVYPPFCWKNGELPPDFTAVGYYHLFSSREFSTSDLERLKIPISEFFSCKIVSSGIKRDCNIEDAIIASHYSDTNAPNTCFTINSLWGNPNKTIQKIKKTDKIQIEFNIDISFRGENISDDEIQDLKYNPVSNPVAQLGIHWPYTSTSPFIEGYNFIGGKKYKVKVTKDEKHLLPPPYQTNCTDYVPEWRMRGNVGPLNQVMLIQECKLNASLRELGCVPFTIDFPHSYTVCRYCAECKNQTSVGENCTDLLRYYNQPCENVQYQMIVEEMMVYTKRELKNSFMVKPEMLMVKERGYNCTNERIFTKKCQRIQIDIVFDNFDITNLTYNPKFESMELFSVIGGYMGMYLGVSLVAVYDFAEMVITTIHLWTKKSEVKKSRKKLGRKKFATPIYPLYTNSYTRSARER